jgi:hypothetical protein
MGRCEVVRLQPTPQRRPVIVHDEDVPVTAQEVLMRSARVIPTLERPGHRHRPRSRHRFASSRWHPVLTPGAQERHETTDWGAIFVDFLKFRTC